MLDIARLAVSSRLKNSPACFLPIAALRESSKRRRIRRSTEVVIEGYWRCANHFAVYAFQVAQRRRVEIAHHFHAPAQIMIAARRRVPAILVIREPRAAITSASIFLERIDPLPLLKFYNRFHRAVLPYASQAVVSDFLTTTESFGDVIRSVNAKYDKNFAPFHDTEEGRAQVDGLIRAEHASNMGGVAATLPLPSAEKNRRKQAVIDRLDELSLDPCYRSLCVEAHDLYHELRGYACRDLALGGASAADGRRPGGEEEGAPRGNRGTPRRQPDCERSVLLNLEHVVDARPDYAGV